MMDLRLIALGRATLLAAAVVLGGCSGEDDDGDDGATFDPTMQTDPTNGMDETGETAEPDVTFSDLESLFQTRCIDGCHEPGGLWPMFDMSGDTYDRIVGMPAPFQGMQCNLVEPGDTDRSYLWHKIAGTQMNCGGSGVQMPVDPENTGMAVPLPQEEMDLIEAWIEGGAPR